MNIREPGLPEQSGDAEFRRAERSWERAILLERIDEARKQLDSGEFVECDESGLRDFFNALKQRLPRADDRFRQL